MTAQGQPALSAPTRQALEVPAGPFSMPAKECPAGRRIWCGAADLTSAPLGSLNWSVSSAGSPFPLSRSSLPPRHRCAPGRHLRRRCGVCRACPRRAGVPACTRQPARRDSRARLYMRRAPCHHGRWRVPGMPPGWWAQAMVGSTVARQGLQGGGRPQGETDRRQGTSHRVWNSNGYLPTHPRSTAARADSVVVRGAGAAGPPSQDSGVRSA